MLFNFETRSDCVKRFEITDDLKVNIFCPNAFLSRVTSEEIILNQPINYLTHLSFPLFWDIYGRQKIVWLAYFPSG